MLKDGQQGGCGQYLLTSSGDVAAFQLHNIRHALVATEYKIIRFSDSGIIDQAAVNFDFGHTFFPQIPSRIFFPFFFHRE